MKTRNVNFSYFNQVWKIYVRSLLQDLLEA